jgi:hypothetical protein
LGCPSVSSFFSIAASDLTSLAPPAASRGGGSSRGLGRATGGPARTGPVCLLPVALRALSDQQAVPPSVRNGSICASGRGPHRWRSPPVLPCSPARRRRIRRHMPWGASRSGPGQVHPALTGAVPPWARKQ